MSIVCTVTDQDGAEPSTNSVAAMNLVRLADLLERAELRNRAEQIFAGYGQRLAKYPFILPKMLVAYQWWARPPTHVCRFFSYHRNFALSL